MKRITPGGLAVPGRSAERFTRGGMGNVLIARAHKTRAASPLPTPSCSTVSIILRSCLVCLVLTGCAGPAPKLFPIAPIEVKHLPGGVTERWYNTLEGGRGDRCEQLGPDGRVTRIGYADAAGQVEYVTLDEVPADQQRHLMVLLDSVPFSMVKDAYAGGRFRYCHPPGRTIAPFPVMTDLSISDFFGNSPSPGVESEYFDGERLAGGYDTYASSGNVTWEKYVDYRLSPLLHAEAYLDPYPWLDHELRAIREGFLKTAGTRYAAYVVGTSAVGAKYGRNGHQVAIVRVDRLCQDLLFATRGRARITLLSDHGHAFHEDSRRIPLRDVLESMGYRVGTRLRTPVDLIVPEFGMVSCAVIHTRTPAPAARDAVAIAGVEIAAYMDGPEMVVRSRDGLARVARSGDRFHYQAERGDPLQLGGAAETLVRQGLIDAQGYADDDDWFRASADGVFPDALQRLWHAFHGLVEHPPDVVLSLQESYFVGAISMTRLIDLVGIHGNLRPDSSCGFAMTMAGPLPPVQRMPDLRTSLLRLHVPVGGEDNAQLLRTVGRP